MLIHLRDHIASIDSEQASSKLPQFFLTLNAPIALDIASNACVCNLKIQSQSHHFPHNRQNFCISTHWVIRLYSLHWTQIFFFGIILPPCQNTCIVHRHELHNSKCHLHRKSSGAPQHVVITRFAHNWNSIYIMIPIQNGFSGDDC